MPSCQVWGAWSVHVVCIGVLLNFLLWSKVCYRLSLIALVIDCNHNTIDMFANPVSAKTNEKYVRSGGRLTANEIAAMKEPILPLSKSKKDKKSKNDKKSKKAKKPKKIKNAAKDTNNAKNKNKANGNGNGLRGMNVIFVPWAGMDGGQEFQLAVNASETICDVKRKIFTLTGIWLKNLRVTFAGKGLADGKTLAFYNIQDGAKLTYYSTVQ